MRRTPARRASTSSSSRSGAASITPRRNTLSLSAVEDIGDANPARVLGGRGALDLEALLTDVEDDIRVDVVGVDTVQRGQPLLAVEQVQRRLRPDRGRADRCAARAR